MNFLYGFIMFFIGLISFIAFLPIFNELVSILPYDGIVVVMCGVMVLLLAIGLVYRLYVDSTMTNYMGGYGR
jgi:uncharacterized membrane protein YhhN